jgi:hypothetical protein
MKPLRADRDELKGRVERLQTDNQRLLGIPPVAAAFSKFESA